MSTTDRVAAIRARLDAASPGPWTTKSYDREHFVDGPPVVGYDGGLALAEDAHLIANAPADLAWLLDQLEATQARAAAAEARLERSREASSARIQALVEENSQLLDAFDGADNLLDQVVSLVGSRLRRD